MLSHCATCTAIEEDCCTSDYAKFITLQDAERISTFLNQDIKEFAVFALLSNLDKETDLFIEKPHHYYYDFAQDGKILQLKKNKDGSCVFFKSGKCSIHQVRPLTCRAYPFWYKKVEIKNERENKNKNEINLNDKQDNQIDFNKKLDEPVNEKIEITIDDNGRFCPIVIGSFEKDPVDRKTIVSKAMIHSAGETEDSLQKLFLQLDKELFEYKEKIKKFIELNLFEK